MAAPAATPLQTEYEFTLPDGYVDAKGNVHRKGIMRRATAMDEIAPLRDPRVKNNQAYLTVLLLTRVVTKLGDLNDVNPNIIENMFTTDVAFLQDFYRKINSNGSSHQTVTCPECNHTFEIEDDDSGEA
jgi:hypothetical protein